MVCYARPAGMLAVIVVLSALVFGAPISHFVDTAAFVAVAAAITAAVAVAVALLIAASMSVRRRRAAAGACVTCQFRCQHAMTERSGRQWLVTAADRGRSTAAPWGPGDDTGHREPVLLPMPSVRSGCDQPGPRWPDRPVHRTSQVSHRAAAAGAAARAAHREVARAVPHGLIPAARHEVPAPQRERAGSPA